MESKEKNEKQKKRDDHHTKQKVKKDSADFFLEKLFLFINSFVFEEAIMKNENPSGNGICRRNFRG